MIFKYSKQLLLALSFATASYAFSAPTHTEIVEELAHFRETSPQLDADFNSSARYYLARVDEAKELEKTNGWFEYVARYATFWSPEKIARSYLLDNVVILNKDNAPKTYELIETTAKKLGMTQVPVIYLATNEQSFNALTTGVLQALSVVTLGQKLIKKCPTTQALEFLIARELVRINNSHILKAAVFGVATTATTACLTELHPAFVLSFLASPLFTAYYARLNEREADTIASNIAGIDGGLDFCTFIKEHNAPRVAKDYTTLQEEINKSPLKNSSIFALRVACARIFSQTSETIGSIASTLYQPFSSTPTDDQRINYLQELLEEQEVEVAQA
jgi:Zn-dependent protease with chaperone function